MRIQLTDIVDSYMILELLSGLPSFFEEIASKPYFFKMSFMWIFSEYLFNRNFPLTNFMHSKPNNTEPSSAQESEFVEILGESVPEFLILFRC